MLHLLFPLVELIPVVFLYAIIAGLAVAVISGVELGVALLNLVVLVPAILGVWMAANRLLVADALSLRVTAGLAVGLLVGGWWLMGTSFASLHWAYWAGAGIVAAAGAIGVMASE